MTSRNQHGVHSPFVFDLVTTCFYDKTIYPQYQQLTAYRKNLLQDKKTITITDFGSGSKVFDSNQREISAIAKTSGSTLKNTKLLLRIAHYFQPASILELGTNLGMGTQALALGNAKAKVTTIEGCPEILKVAKENFTRENLINIATIPGDFKEEIPKLTQSHWDLVFLDGHHAKEATLQYFELLLPKAHNDSVFIFDDIHWSPEMAQAWEIIKDHPKVTVTVDIFHWGIVFFRQEQRKEHFKIRV